MKNKTKSTLPSETQDKFATDLLAVYLFAIGRTCYNYFSVTKEIFEAVYLRKFKKYFKKQLAFHNGDLKHLCLHTPFTYNAVKWFVKEYDIDGVNK